MFTGLVSDVGRVTALEERPGGGRRFTIACTYPMAFLELGSSIACAGCCLTVTQAGEHGTESWFTVDVSNESLAKTTLGGWREGTRVNLERSLTLADELGGHLVSGHVDGVASIMERRPDGDSARFVLEAPEHLARFIAAKGSICLDGTSLTVNEVEDSRFGINLIPHTLTVTTWGEREAGAMVNLEVDMMARYAARLLQFADTSRSQDISR